MKFTIFMTVIFLLLFGGKIAVGFYAEQVPFLAALSTPLLWLTIASGVIAGICILIHIVKEIKGVSKNEKEE